MRINICEVTFNTEFAPKKFGSRTFFKISGGSSITSTKMENFFLISGITFFQGLFC